MLNTKQVAQQLAVSPDTVRKLIAANALKAVNVAPPWGTRPLWRITQESVDLFLKERESYV